MPESTPEVILQNASYHSHILSAIAELDYIPSAVPQQVAYVKDLEAQPQRRAKKLKKLAAATKKEQEEYIYIRDSTVLRLAHHLIGRKAKYKEKVSKEEREFRDALEQESMEKDSQELLRQMLNEAKEEEAELLAKAAQYDSLRGELQSLYSKIFNGPTPDFPEDDKLEDELKIAQALHERVQTDLNAECQVAQLLTQADEIMGNCLAKMKQTLDFNRRGVSIRSWRLHDANCQWLCFVITWGGGGYSEYKEKKTFSAAQGLARQAELLFRQAQSLSPVVTPVGEFVDVIPFEGSRLGMLFDKHSLDRAFRRKVKRMISNIQQVQNCLKVERDSSQRRADVAGAQLIEVAKELEESRKALDTLRRETFQSLSSGRNPVYSSPSASSDHQATSNVAAGPFLPQDYPPPIPPQTSSETPPLQSESRNSDAASLSMGPQI